MIGAGCEYAGLASDGAATPAYGESWSKLCFLPKRSEFEGVLTREVELEREIATGIDLIGLAGSA